MTFSREEQETVINFNEAEKTATVCTHNPALIRRLEALADQRPKDAQRGRVFPDGGHEYSIPKRWVKVSAGRMITEERRKALGQRAKELNYPKLPQNAQ